MAAADLVVIGKSARISSAFAKIGFTPDSGSTTTVTRRIGPARARRFFLLAETMNAEAALSAGLVDYVVDDDVVLAGAEKIARELASGPTAESSAYSWKRPIVRWRANWKTRRRPWLPSRERRMLRRVSRPLRKSANPSLLANNIYDLGRRMMRLDHGGGSGPREPCSPPDGKPLQNLFLYSDKLRQFCRLAKSREVV
jgi:enoyl-CoA hydratase/carnithine racemase